jgi:arylsulfatase A-like enzyme
MRLLHPFLIACCIFISVVQASFGIDQPNIIFIIADDLGRNDISFYGQGKNGVQTPHIDKIFQSGVSFPNFYANSPVCSPTRAALMSGLYPDHAGVPGVIRQNAPDSWGYLRKDIKLLPERLKLLGYSTSMIGKWHLGYGPGEVPNDRGFAFFQGFLGDMMDDYYTHLRGGKNWMRLNQNEINPAGHATDLFTQWAVEEIEKQAKSAKPFFLYLAYNAPHDPIQPTAEWLERVRSRNPELTEKRAKLVALIEQMDDGVGKLLNAVKRTGIEQKTIIVFTSDNGGQLSHAADNGPCRGTKGEMYEGGLRVVCSARWPGQFPAGLQASVPAATFDWYPTIIQLAGGDLNTTRFDGRSLGQVLRNPAANTDFQNRELYFVRREGGPVFAGKTIEALRIGPWKLVLNTPFEPAGLFQLDDDPYEKKDLSTVNQAKRNELIRRLQLHLQQAGRIPWQKTPIQEDK